MKTTVYPLALYRIPQLPLTATLESSWKTLKASIETASPNFYKVIENVQSHEIDQQPRSVKQTIWKYFNRSKYRATPFGSFAGTCQVPLQGHYRDQPERIVIGNQNLHSFIDWSITTDKVMQRIQLNSKDKIFSNSSYYKHHDAFRYLTSNEREFNLSDLPYDEVIEAVLSLCQMPIYYFELLIKLRETFADFPEPEKLIKGLVLCQLLLTSRQPNIIGEDFFTRIKFNKKVNKVPYIIAERNLSSGSFDKHLVSKLPALINLLRNIEKPSEQELLQNFRNKFQQRYEMAAVPLMLALDPELGIGYGDFAFATNSSDTFDFLEDNHADDKVNDDLRNHFRRALSCHSTERKAIDLKDVPVVANENPFPLPNSFGLLGYQYENQIVIEKMGGITTNMLLGRFTLASNEILGTCRDIARIEQEANPEVIFFDVAYMGEPNVDNVNRRQAIYPYQLALLNYDTSDEPLCLNDLYVFVSGNEVILRSQRLNRRLIPRIASAYNYDRSDLSVFRFLSDLQYQNLQRSLHVNLEMILPFRNYYPRLIFENFILSPAKWHLENNDISESSNITEYLDRIQMSRYFRAGSGDQTLTFDKENNHDLVLFQSMLNAQKRVTVEEAFIPEVSTIINAQGDPFAHQFIMGITHNDTLYTDKKPRMKKGSQVINYPPGSEWLYFEIYTHTANTDRLLVTALEPVLRQWKQRIACFFFVRYQDQGEHLRFRIKVKDQVHAFPIVNEISKRLSKDISSGAVSSFRLSTYYPEIHRYGSRQMRAVEQHFQKDTAYVLSLLKSNFPVPIKYTLCAMLFEELEKGNNYTEEAMLALLNTLSASFNKEHKLKSIHFKRMNVEYNTFRNTLRPYLTAQQCKYFLLFTASFKATLELNSDAMRPALFADLMHMHINRLFHERQRTHEMMIYYFVHKDIQRRINCNLMIDIA